MVYFTGYLRDNYKGVKAVKYSLEIQFSSNVSHLWLIESSAKKLSAVSPACWTRKMEEDLARAAAAAAAAKHLKQGRKVA